MLDVVSAGVYFLEDYTNYKNVITILTKSELSSYKEYLSILKDKERLIIEANDYDYKSLLSSKETFDDIFTKEHARKIIEFALNHKNEPILVHCAAGISRSHAVALFIAKHIKKDNDLFNKLYHDDRKIEGGNILIYKTLDEVGFEYEDVHGSNDYLSDMFI